MNKKDRIWKTLFLFGASYQLALLAADKVPIGGDSWWGKAAIVLFVVVGYWLALE